MAATLFQVPSAARGTDFRHHPRHRVRAAALQARGARRESVRRAPALPAAPTGFPGLSAAAVSGGRPSQPDNSRHPATTSCHALSNCFTRQMPSGTSFAPTPLQAPPPARRRRGSANNFPGVRLTCAPRRAFPRARRTLFLSQVPTLLPPWSRSGQRARYAISKAKSPSRCGRSWPRS